MTQNAHIQIQSSGSTKMLRSMVGIGIMCALLIVLTYETTLPRIEKNKAEALQKAIFKVIPGITQSQPFTFSDQENFVPLLEGQADGSVLFAGYDRSGNFSGVAIEASGQGYADVIRILYGYDPKLQKVIGFYVLESKETPGLGDKIEKDERFLRNFEALDVALTNDLKDLINPVVTVKQGGKVNAWEIDGITGATISSRAIGSIIGESIEDWAPLIQKNIDFFENSSDVE